MDPWVKDGSKLRSRPSAPRNGYGVSLWICFPSAWRALRVKGLRLFAVVLLAWAECLAAGYLAAALSPAFRGMILNLPRYLTSA